MRSALRPHATSLLLLLAVAACFGPYLGGSGLRTEQLILYGLACPAVLSMLRKGSSAWATPMFPWLGFASIAAIVGYFPHAVARPGWGPYLAGVDNALLPVAAAVVGMWLLTREHSHDLLMKLAGYTLTFLAGNALIMIWQLAAGTPRWLGHFWTSTGAIDFTTVAGRSLGDDRVGGVFNQPLEAGVAYSVGCILAVYWLHYRRPQPWRLGVGALVLFGGLMPVSKVLILGGLPVAVLLFVYLERHRAHRVILAAVASLPFFGLLLISGWRGADRILGLFDRSSQSYRSAAQFYSAGRYGETGTLQQVVDQVMEHSPWIGFGARGIAHPYDSSYIEALVVGGVVGLALYVGTLAVLLATLPAWKTSPAKWTTLAVLAFVIGAGLGGSTLTANRAGPLAAFALVFTLGQRFGPRPHASRGLAISRPSVVSHGI